MTTAVQAPTTRAIRQMQQPLQQAAIFAVLCLGLALIFALINHPVTLGLYMFIPTISTIILLLLFTRRGQWRQTLADLGLHRLAWRAWLPALLLPLVVLLAAYGAVWFFTPATYQGFPHPVKWPNLSLYLAILILFQTLTMSLGEELGWRGYLLPRLLVLGRLPAYLLGGLLWAVWHYPLIFLLAGYNTEGNKALTTVLFTSVVLCLSIILGELRRRTGSVWPASLFHSAHNVFWQQLVSLSVSGSPLLIYLAGESGLITIMLYGLVAALLLLTSRKHQPQL